MSRSQWKHVQVLAEQFWRQWRKEFLPLLQARKKWNQESRNLEAVYVLMKDEQEARNDWSLNFNNCHPSIKFTMEEMHADKIPVLDTLIIRRDNGSLTFSVYRKPTHTDQYLKYDSHQSLEHILGVIRTLTHRANTICSTDDRLEQEIDHLKQVLRTSGYSKKNQHSSKKKTPNPSTIREHLAQGHITSPYVGGVSESIARKIRKLDVMVHTKPVNTIRSMLVAPKDKTNTLEKSGAIYHIQCADCPATYVGEIKRELSGRGP
ncbi:uncharacterized protein LOC117340038 [Pecten maximus]|uniref:uncharacterized protein LOC117340038 n=1 Tax=Pecten maximus TaxID=6579 RepID=UPI0014586CF9|nr:uncharacterized protein LOC117340038 [Pecten maximus]